VAAGSAAGADRHTGERHMPIEIRRFGVGHRRPDGPIGTHGLTGQVIHSDARGVVSELAFTRGARIEPHANPNTTWFIVIEGGGWVGVGDERTRVAAGEAVLWPADLPHAAWTEHSEMRAFVVEFAGADDHGVLDGQALALAVEATNATKPPPADGSLADDGHAARRDHASGEPA
jgi:quercetin dioxygenase-like cupin family protein